MERKMMMFNNHCHAHLKHLINLRNIHTDFLPPSTKEPLQHMAQGMIRVRSNSGRSWCVNCFNNLNQDPSTILSTLPILDALHFFSMCNNRLLCNCYVLSQSRLRLWCCWESECTNRQSYILPMKISICFLHLKALSIQMVPVLTCGEESTENMPQDNQ